MVFKMQMKNESVLQLAPTAESGRVPLPHLRGAHRIGGRADTLQYLQEQIRLQRWGPSTAHFTLMRSHYLRRLYRPAHRRGAS